MKKHLIVLILMGAAFARESYAQTVFNSQHELLVQTIRAGQASGVMAGDTAAMFSKQFRSDGILLANSSVIKSFEGQPSCKRLEVVYTKKNVMSTKGPRDLKMNMKVNYCLDGKPPKGVEGSK